jgi:ribonucleoside-triphosphate reductase
MADSGMILQPATIRKKNEDETNLKIPEHATKRDGRVVPFERMRIKRALDRCYDALERLPGTPIDEITRQVVNVIAAQYPEPTVEQIQDTVEMVLQANGEYAAAKAYILYRAEHARLRQTRAVPTEVKQAFDEADQYFPTPIQRFQFYDKYSRFDYDLGRRETWLETVGRAVDYLRELSEYRLPEEDYPSRHSRDEGDALDAAPRHGR